MTHRHTPGRKKEKNRQIEATLFLFHIISPINNPGLLFCTRTLELCANTPAAWSTWVLQLNFDYIEQPLIFNIY